MRGFKCDMPPFKCDMSPMEHEIREKQFVLKAMRELDEFKQCITSIVENYIKMIDTKISNQDYKIDNSVIFISNNLRDIAYIEITKMFENGEITVEGYYDENSESLSLVTDVNETLITNFYYDDHPFIFVEGMTWQEFVSSAYNIDNHFSISNDGVVYDSNKQIAHLRSFDNPNDYSLVHVNDKIKNKAIYVGV